MFIYYELIHSGDKISFASKLSKVLENYLGFSFAFGY